MFEYVNFVARYKVWSIIEVKLGMRHCSELTLHVPVALLHVRVWLQLVTCSAVRYTWVWAWVSLVCVVACLIDWSWLWLLFHLRVDSCWVLIITFDGHIIGCGQLSQLNCLHAEALLVKASHELVRWRINSWGAIHVESNKISLLATKYSKQTVDYICYTILHIEQSMTA